MDLQDVDLSLLPAFYQSAMNAWQAFSFSFEMVTYDMKMFLSKTLFYNPFLENSMKEKGLIRHFIDGFCG